MRQEYDREQAELYWAKIAHEIRVGIFKRAMTICRAREYDRLHI